MTQTSSRPVDLVASSERDDAVADLLRQHRSTAQRAVRAVLGVSADEEDLVQEVLTRLVIRLRQPGEIAAGAWTWSVAHNVAVDHLRARRATPVDHTTMDRGVGEGLDDHVISAEMAAAVNLGLSRLPERQRDALLARANLDGDRGGHALVAATLGVSPKAAESILARARQSMRRELERIGHATGPWAAIGVAARALGRLVRGKTATVAGAALIAALTVGTSAVLVYRTVAPGTAARGTSRPATSAVDAASRRAPSSTSPEPAPLSLVPRLGGLSLPGGRTPFGPLSSSGAGASAPALPHGALPTPVPGTVAQLGGPDVLPPTVTSLPTIPRPPA